jgi:hypothetical protein
MGLLIGRQLQRVAFWARVVGWSGVASGGVGLCLHVFEDRPGIEAMWIFAAVVVFIASVLPSVGLIVLGGRLEDGAHWAFYPIAVLSVLGSVPLVFSPACFCLPVLVLFSMILAGACFNGYAEMKAWHRQCRRKEKRGFEPIMTTPLATVAPPPPARGRRKPAE